jgi:hypothetical protein
LVLAIGSATSVAELVLPWQYPQRIATDRIVMFYDSRVTDPEGDLRAMEAHVERMELETGLRLRAPVFWVRGSLLGKQAMALPGFALGSAQSPADALDRHELAHVVLAQHFPVGTIPPMLLNEGWAEAQAQPPRQLAEAAVWLREFLFKTCASATPDQIEDMLSSTVDPEGYRDLCDRVRRDGAESFLFLDVLTNDFWYGRDQQPVYSIGGAFCDFVIRRHGAARLAELVLATRPGKFAEACRSVLGEDLAVLELEFWRDVETELPTPAEHN